MLNITCKNAFSIKISAILEFKSVTEKPKKKTIADIKNKRKTKQMKQ